jgi:hypothetical protein
MDKYQKLKGQRLIAIFLVGCLLFNYPLLHLFSVNSTIGGVPVLYVYVFSSWAALIGLMVAVIERHR